MGAPLSALKALAGLGLVVLLSGCCSFGGSSSAEARPVDWCIQADHQSDYRDLEQVLVSDNMKNVAPCDAGVDANYHFTVARFAKRNGEFKVEVTYPLDTGGTKTLPMYGRVRKGESEDETAHRLFKAKWEQLQAVIGEQKL